MTARPSLDERLYAALLRLYPSQFRDRYGEAILEFYRDQRGAAIARRRAPWREFGRAAINVIAGAMLERLSQLRARPTRRASTHSENHDMLETIRQDVRYAIRGLARAPVFTATVLGTLALAIGANVAIFAVLNGVLLRPYPLPDPDRVVLASFQRGGALSEPEFLDYERDLKSASHVAVYVTGEANLTGGQEAERLALGRVSGDFFSLLGVVPAIGRALTRADDDPSAPAVAVISHGLWMRRFGGTRGILDSSMMVNGRPVRIVGVTPAGFTFPSQRLGAWVPLQLDRGSPRTRANHYLQFVARLAPGVTPDAMKAEIATITERWRRTFPDGYSQTRPYTPAVDPIRDRIVGSSRPYLLALGGAVGFVLLVACVNVASLVLVRADSRSRELAIRTALGAGRSRLVGQLFTESALLTVGGTALGLALAWLGTRLLVQFGEGSIPRLADVRLDASVLGFSVAISALTGLLIGTAPAFRASRTPASSMLRDTTRTARGNSTRRVRRALVVTEISLAVLLLTGAGLLIRSLLNLQAVELGFAPERVLTFRVSLPRQTYPGLGVGQYFRDLTTQLSAQPSVVAAGAMEWTPLGGIVPQWTMLRDGDVTTPPNAAPSASPLQVTGGYFEAMGIAILRGRAIRPTDDANAPPVVVVSQSLATRFWPGQEAIGHTIRVFRDDAEWATVVGVARDTRFSDLETDPTAMMYFPVAQAHRTTYGLTSSMRVAMRTSGDPTVAVNTARRIVRDLDKDVPISDVVTLESIVRGSIATRRFSTMVLGLFAAAALALASLGIYGVIAYGVSQRAFELGVRMALGADRRSVVSLIVGEGLRLAGAGLAIGVVGSLVGARYVRSMLVGVPPRDVTTLVVVSIVLLAVALLAAIVPARRASAVQPTVALRGS